MIYAQIFLFSTAILVTMIVFALISLLFGNASPALVAAAIAMAAGLLMHISNKRIP